MDTRYSSASNKVRSSGFKKLGKTSIASISVLLILLLSASCALAWPVEDLKVTPESPICTYSGNITITGKVGPGDTVPLITTFVKEVNVTDGKYVYDAGLVPIPAGVTLCSITAENVKDMTVTTNLFGIPISKTQDASNGKAALSTPLIPKGMYSLSIEGNAVATNAIANCNDGTSNDDTQKTVKLTFVAKMEVKADENGYFKQVCCTMRPAGEYTMKVGDKTTTITLIDCGNADTPDASSSSSNTNQVASSSSTGSAAVQSSTAGNATVMNSVSPVVEDGPEDVNDAAGQAEQVGSSVQTNSIMGYIQAILNWLGF